MKFLKQLFLMVYYLLMAVGGIIVALVVGVFTFAFAAMTMDQKGTDSHKSLDQERYF